MPNYAQLTAGNGKGNVALAPRVAEGLIQQVLGRRLDLYKGGRIPEEIPRKEAQDLINLLTLRFPKVVDPQTEVTSYEWQRGVSVGELMPIKLLGSQASLCRRTQKAVADALSLLDTIGPIIADARADVVDDKKAVVKSELNAIVTELCRAPQPRAVQVDELFEALLTREENGGAEGHLGQLQEAAGLDEANVETLTDEEIVTNFRTARDYVKSLRTSWDSWKADEAVYLGTQVMRLSIALPVVRATVQAVRDALFQAGVQEGELRIIDVCFRGKEKKEKKEITVDDLLTLIEGEVDRWSGLVMDGGKSGVRAITPFADEVNEVLRKALESAISAPRYKFSAAVYPKEAVSPKEKEGKIHVTGEASEDVETLRRLAFLDLNPDVRLAVLRLQREMEEIVDICHQGDEEDEGETKLDGESMS